jgi:uncharacterized membrane protein YsdA (DUF1294 family)
VHLLGLFGITLGILASWIHFHHGTFRTFFLLLSRFLLLFSTLIFIFIAASPSSCTRFSATYFT